MEDEYNFENIPFIFFKKILINYVTTNQIDHQNKTYDRPTRNGLHKKKF